MINKESYQFYNSDLKVLKIKIWDSDFNRCFELKYTDIIVWVLYEKFELIETLHWAMEGKPLQIRYSRFLLKILLES